MAETTKRFQRGETVVVEAEVKNQAGAYVDPATTMLVTITKPDGVAGLTDQAMTKDAVGQYHHDYKPSDSDPLGWYRVHFVATDTTRVTIQDSGFTLGK